MAWTGIHAIRFDIGYSINYTLDENKTALSNAVDYALNKDKTKNEKTIFEAAIGCGKDTAYKEMIAVKMKFGKEGGVQGYHLVQSFKTGEVTPALCHEIGQELVRRLLPEGFQAVVSSHLNTDQLHNHLVWNSVNSITGKKYHIGEKDLYLTIRRISDDLCREHGLSIIDPKPGSRGKHYAEILAERNGQPTQRSTLREVIDRGVADNRVFSPQAMLDYLAESGYEVNANPRHKHVTVRAPGAARAIRLGEKLGEGYSWEDICRRIAEKRVPPRSEYARDRSYVNLDNDSDEYTRSPRQKNSVKYRRSIFQRTSLRAAFSLRGLRGLYFSYLYRMGVRPNGRRLDPEESLALKTDIGKLNKRIRMMQYLSRTGFETVEQLHAREAELQAQTKPLLAERKKLYRKPDAQARIDEINEQLRPIWAEIYLCRDIEKHSLDIRKQLRDVREARQGLYAEQEQAGRRRTQRHL